VSTKPSDHRIPEYLGLVFHQVPGAVWATDRQLRLTYVHGRTLSLDQDAAEKLVGATVYEFVASHDPTEPAVAHHLAALAGERQAFQYVRGGRWFEVLLEPLRDDAGDVVGCAGAAIDITDHRGVREQLARSEAKLAEAQRVAHVGSFEWDVRRDVIVWSAELQRIYGVATEPVESLEGLLGRVHGDDQARVRAAFFEAVHYQKPFAYDHRIIRGDGGLRVLHTAGDVVLNGDGAALRVVGSCWDITEQHETTERLERSVSLLRATLDATADGILVVDREGRVTARNKRFLQMWRVPASLAQRGDDRTLLEFVGNQLADPRAFADGVRALYDAPTDEAFDVLSFKDERVFERYSTPQLLDNDVVGRVWSFRDVTERERLLRRATFLADASRVLATLDLERALHAVAHLAVPYLGDRCAIDVMRNGHPIRLVSTPSKHDEPPVELHSTTLAGHSVMYTAWGRSQVGVPLLCRETVMGGMTFVAPPSRQYTKTDLEVMEELGRRVALSMDNARLYEGAKHALNSRDEFMSIAAHEIRGPLTAIHLAAQSLLRESLPSPAARTALEVIQKEDRRLSRFVEELLDLGRIRSGQLSFALEEVDVGTVVRDVVSRLAADAAEAGSVLTVKTDGDLTGQWDCFRLDQVFTNLVSNAIKFGMGKPIDITGTERDGKVTVSVTDRGKGIAPEMRDRIFDPFERGIGTRHYGGLGLGLHIAKTIVEGLGGTLSVDSRPGVGSTFTMALPAREDADDGQTNDSRGGR
jgi:PAS domain S-box-containing protein